MIRIKEYNDDYRQLYDFIATIPDKFAELGEVIYEDRNTIRTIKAPDGTMLNVKRYCKPWGVNRYVYSMGIRKPKGERAFIYPEILHSKGIDTPVPVAYIEERHCGVLAYSWFVSLHCPYEHTMKDTGDVMDERSESLARHFGRFTAGLHDRRLMHLDYSPGNILYHVTDSGDYRFSLVDINRLRYGKPVSIREGILNLRRLWGPKQFFVTIVEEYVRARGGNPEEWVSFALDERARFWKRFGKKHNIHFKLEL